MNARNHVKRRSDRGSSARRVLAAARLRLAARVDVLVARWLERRAANAEATQRWFTTDQKPTDEVGVGASLVVSFPGGDEPP